MSSTMKFLILVFALFLSSFVQAGELHGKVVGITDGDTVTIVDESRQQYKIRLAGIDAPEKKQPFGKASKKSLSDFIYNKSIIVETTKNDRYGRVVGKILLDGQDINKLQIERGMAWFYRKYQNELVLDDRLAYLHAEQNAKANNLGVWSDSNPLAPWEYRKR